MKVNWKNKTFWKILTGATIIISVITGVWAVEDRFVIRELYNKDITIIHANAEKLEQDVIESMQQLRKDFREARLHDTLNSLIEQKFKLRKAMRENPNDTELKLEYDELVKEINRIKEKLDELKKEKESSP